MGDSRNAISAEGRAEAEAELRHLTEVRRPEIVSAIKTAREFGDLKENAEYHAAREAQAMNESRIRVLEHHLARAEVTEPASGGVAGVGSRVAYRDLDNDKSSEVTLAHQLEADIGAGKLSVESPIGAALLGAAKGRTVEVETPRGDLRRLEVLELG